MPELRKPPEDYSELPRGTGALYKSLLENAFYEPENPVFRERGCRQVILTNPTESSRRGHTSWSRVYIIYYLLGALYRPARVVKVKSYAVVCPEGVGLFIQWFSKVYHDVILTGVGSPSIIAEEARFTNPLALVTPAEQCEAIREALARKGITPVFVERRITGSKGHDFYICLAQLRERKNTYTRSLR